MQLVLREVFLENEVYVTARKKWRLVDYQRFPRLTYSRDLAMESLRMRFRLAKLEWSEGSDEEFLRHIKALKEKKGKVSP